MEQKDKYYSETGGHVLTPFFDVCQDRRSNGEGLLIWMGAACMTWELANFVVADGLKRYSDLERTGVYGMEIGR